MGDTCVELKSDKTALSLYNDLLVRSENDEGKFDRGYWESDYTSSSTPSRILKSLQDGKVCAQEVYDEAIETGAIEIPWTLQDKDVLKKAEAALGRRATGEAIMTFITDARDGLGVRFDSEGKGPVRSPDQVIADKKATCIEFVFLFLAIARRTGCPAEIVAEERNGLAHLRISIPAQDDSSQSALFDLDPNFDPNKKSNGHLISERELLAAFHITRAFRNNAHDKIKETAKFVEFAIRELDLAESFDPNHYLIAFNKGCLFLQRGSFSEALNAFQKAARLNPYYPDVFYNLAVTHEKLGDEINRDGAFEKYRSFTEP